MKSYREERAIELRRRKLILGVFLVIAVFALGRSWVFDGIKKSALLVAEPAWQAASVGASAVGDLHDATRSRDEILAENIKLRRELNDASLSIKADSALRIENAQLRALGGRTSTEPRIMARVLARPPASAYDTFIIDAGSAEGVGVGMRALIAGNFLVGTVISVGEHSSVVELASTSGVAFDASLAGSISEGTTSAPEFSTEQPDQDQGTTTNNSAVTSVDLTSTSTQLMTSTSTQITAVSCTSTKKGKDKVEAAAIIAKRSSVTFLGLGGGGFRALVPKQVPVVRDEPISLSTSIPSFLGVVTGVYVPPSGSLKEIYGALPVGIGEIEFLSLAPALPLALGTVSATTSSRK